MNITLILPFLLFFLAIIISMILVEFKINKSNQNTSAQKRILEKVRKAEQNLNENIVLTEERISAQKNEVNNISRNIDKKVQELTSHNQELATLSNTLNEYRSMLAMLEVSTNKTHEWVITVRNDCRKLEQLQKVIEEHQKSTLEIINSYGDAVEKQNDFYGEYESKLDKIKKNYVNELNDYIKVNQENLNSKIISIGQVADETVEVVERAKSELDRVSTNHKAFVDESKEILESYKKERDETLHEISKDLDKKMNNYTSQHQSSLNKINDNYLEKYSKEINTLNYKKKEEVDDALNKLILSIEYLNKKENNLPENIVSEKDAKLLNKKNNTKENQLVKSKKIKKTKVEESKNTKNEDKVFVPIGEEEEISLD